jgi:hypothetical protein
MKRLEELIVRMNRTSSNYHLPLAAEFPRREGAVKKGRRGNL